MTQREFIHALDRETAWQRLGSVSLGRLSTSLGALPIVVPVHFLTSETQLVFALQPESPLARSIDGSVFAFEASGRHDDSQRWWTVHVRGQASANGPIDGLARLDLSSPVVSVTGEALSVRGGEVDSLEHLPQLSDYLTRGF